MPPEVIAFGLIGGFGLVCALFVAGLVRVSMRDGSFRAEPSE
jgi:hypothetical protein